MANVKDLLVNGSARIIGTIYGNATSANNSDKLDGKHLNEIAAAKSTTLAWNTSSTVATIGGNNITVTMPANPNTWRGIQNNLTSDSTTDSLSAAQGKALKSLVDGKASSSHTHDDRYYTESEMNTKLNAKLNTSLKGSAGGLAELDSNGKVPSTQLPSYVDDVIEGYLYNSKFYKESSHTTVITGETGKIYIDLSNNKTYRWSGSTYAVISETLALGETSSTAYRGDRGKIAYDHSQSTHARTDATKVEASSINGKIKINGSEVTVYAHPSGTNPHGTTKSDVGLGNVGNFKAVSTVANQGLTDTEKANARANIGAGTSSFSGSYTDLSNKPTIPTVGNGTITITQNGTSKGTFTTNQSGNTTIALTDNNTTYSNATTSAAGLMSKDDKTKLDGITASADSVSFSRSLTNGIKVGTITINGVSTDLYAPTNTDTHYASKNVVGSSTATSNTTSALTNGNVYLNSVENGAVTSAHKISGSGATTVTTDTSGNIIISSTDTNTNTWRPVVDNLTSTATDSSLSANQGKVLKGLIDGKANTNHTHSYLPLSGGTLTGNLQIGNSDASSTSADAVGIIVRDLRAVSMAPSTLGDRTAVFYFDEAGPSGDNSWKGILRVKGWADSYAAWELAGPATSADTKEFYVRSGPGGGTWGSWRKLLTDDNYTSYTVTKTGSGASGTWGINITGSSKSISYHAQLKTDDEINAFNANNTLQVATWNNTSSPGITNGIIINAGWENTTYGAQIAIDDDPTHYIALRQRNGSGWNAWKRIPMGDGTGASGTWGISISGNAATATKATKDSADQQINTTYIKGLSVSGRTITYTKGDGSTGTITTQDTNTTYGVATSSANGLMSSADKSKLDGIAAGANNYSHPTSSGNKHIPTGGSSGQILRWSADGTAVWGADTNTWRGIQNNLTSDSTTDSLAAAQGKILKTLVDQKLEKTTYEYNKELALGSSGKVCIGKFPCYDSNISVEIKSTTNTTYNGTLIIATQNINTSLGGVYKAVVYGDENNTLTNSIKIEYLSGSNVFSVYINLPSWSKNILHIQCVSLAGTPTNIATIVDSIPSTATIIPTNAFTHTHSYAGSSSVGGSATSAVKLDSSAGSATQPIYFSNGKPVATTYTLGSSVPSNAKFTDTTYSAATTSAAGLMSASDKSKLDGITASADTVSFSRSLTSGTKVGTITINGTGTDLYAPTNTDTHWTTGLKVGASNTATANAAASNGSVYLNVLDNSTVRDSHKIVGSGATTVTSDANGVITISSTNTTYGVATTSANGLMSSTDKSKLDGIAANANNYSLPAATSSVLGGVKIGSNITVSSGTISLTKANVTSALGYTPPTSDTNTWKANTASSEGYVASGSGQANKVWKTDANGVPAWRADANTTYSVATTSANGLMSSSDKSKLDGIATGATKVTVDSSLSSTSTNPVQNKVINSALAGKAASSHTHDDRYYTESEINTKVNTINTAINNISTVYYGDGADSAIVPLNADQLQGHPASYFATSGELNNIITNGTLKMDLLWTNASPSSAFNAQTVSLDLSRYKYIIIIYSYVWADGHTCALCPIGEYTYLLSGGGTSGAQTGKVQIVIRKADVTTTGVVFKNASFHTVEGYSNNNGFAIPYRIYGVR